jgi:ornithine carbamoyltransferase
MKKDFVSILDLERGEIEALIEDAGRLKKDPRGGERPLAGKTLGLVFTKSSTRTRVSFEVGTVQLGGYPLFLSAADLQLGRGETIPDTARVLSRYLDGIMIRTFDQADVEGLAAHASIPVINGLTDLLHPCQILADLFTIREIFGRVEGVTVAYVGDGNNVANSWIHAAIRLPFRLRIACPEGYDPDASILAKAGEGAAGEVRVIRDPVEAVRDADVIYTDVWTSMGQEAESRQRREHLAPYQVNEALVDASSARAVMHCLPAHRGEEITDGVIDGPLSVVFDQAENRLHAQKAVLVRLMGRR